jgi:glutamine amidotransferase
LPDMTRVAIADYGLCNLDSVRRAVEECGGRAVVTDRPADLAAADRIILPCVGAFRDAMRNLRDRGLDVALTEEVVGASVPFLGICLGMQLIAQCSSEFEDTAGLGWIPARVVRLVPDAVDRRVPHIGWNEVHPVEAGGLFAGLPANADFYFVHSYHVVCDDRSAIAATTPYCGELTSAVHCGNVFGVQFHPEKSQKNGFRLLRNFLTL